MSSSTVAENSKLGTRIGTFDTVDVDTNQRNTYRLIDSANGLFRIRNDFLEVNFVSQHIHFSLPFFDSFAFTFAACSDLKDYSKRILSKLRLGPSLVAIK